eukprot:5315320-Amphidinium_carterae.1
MAQGHQLEHPRKARSFQITLEPKWLEPKWLRPRLDVLRGLCSVDKLWPASPPWRLSLFHVEASVQGLFMLWVTTSSPLQDQTVVADKTARQPGFIDHLPIS